MQVAELMTTLGTRAIASVLFSTYNVERHYLSNEGHQSKQAGYGELAKAAQKSWGNELVGSKGNNDV